MDIVKHTTNNQYIPQFVQDILLGVTVINTLRVLFERI